LLPFLSSLLFRAFVGFGSERCTDAFLFSGCFVELRLSSPPLVTLTRPGFFVFFAAEVTFLRASGQGFFFFFSSPSFIFVGPEFLRLLPFLPWHASSFPSFPLILVFFLFRFGDGPTHLSFFFPLGVFLEFLPKFHFERRRRLPIAFQTFSPAFRPPYQPLVPCLFPPPLFQNGARPHPKPQPVLDARRMGWKTRSHDLPLMNVFCPSTFFENDFFRFEG